jgi:hypothetical protein
VVKAGQTGKMAVVITRIAIILAAVRLQPNSLVKSEVKEAWNGETTTAEDLKVIVWSTSDKVTTYSKSEVPVKPLLGVFSFVMGYDKLN